MSEHLTFRELEDLHAGPAITRSIGMMVVAGEIDVPTAVLWLSDDILTKADHSATSMQIIGRDARK